MPRLRVLRLSLLALLLLSAALPAGGTLARAVPGDPTRPPVVGGPVAYAAATGHHLAGAFLLVWRARGGLTTLGYPLSEATMDARGRWRQVFERGLLTLPAAGYAADLTSARLVTIEALGRELTAGRAGQRAFRPVPAPAGDTALYFPATGHTLAGGFRAHWQAHDGPATLGLPISEEMTEAGLTVQWFERGRLEHDRAAGAVRRTAVGRLAPRAAVLISPAVPPVAGAVALDRLPPLPAPERLARWAADGFGLGEQAVSVLAPVGKGYRLPRTFTPPDLVAVADAGLPASTGTVRGLLLADLAELAQAARARGLPLAVVSAYRSAAYQATVFERQVSRGRARGLDPEQAVREAGRLVAWPGESEHQLGTAVDFNGLDESLGRTPTGRFLAEEGWRYGFLISYPAGAEDRTGYSHEPWHLRGVGRPLAAAVWSHGYRASTWSPSQPTLQEYLESALLLLPPA